MLVLIHVVFLAAEGPDLVALPVNNPGVRSSADGESAFGANDVVGVLVVASIDLPAAEKSADIVRILVVDLEVIEDIAALRGDLPSTDSGATDGRFVAVLGIPPVVSPVMAVRVAIAADAKHSE